MQCHKHYVPVCGSNGDTYQNECYRLQAACRSQRLISRASEGPCSTGGSIAPPPPPPAATSPSFTGQVTELWWRRRLRAGQRFMASVSQLGGRSQAGGGRVRGRADGPHLPSQLNSNVAPVSSQIQDQALETLTVSSELDFLSAFTVTVRGRPRLAKIKAPPARSRRSSLSFLFQTTKVLLRTSAGSSPSAARVNTGRSVTRTLRTSGEPETSF